MPPVPTVGSARGDRRLIVAVSVAGVVLVARWLLVGLLHGGVRVTVVSQALILLGLLAVAIAVIGRGAGKGAIGWSRGPGLTWAVALVSGVALPLVVGQAFVNAEMGIEALTPEATLLCEQVAWPWVVTVGSGILVLEELWFRGLLFQSIEAGSSRLTAVLTTSVLSAMTLMSVASAVLGVGAGLLRAWSGTVLPGLAFRVVAALTWIGWLWSQVPPG